MYSYTEMCYTILVGALYIIGVFLINIIERCKIKDLHKTRKIRYFADVFNDKHPRKAIRAGRGTGKTRWLCETAIKRAIERPEEKILILGTKNRLQEIKKTINSFSSDLRNIEVRECTPLDYGPQYVYVDDAAYIDRNALNTVLKMRDTEITAISTPARYNDNGLFYQICKDKSLGFKEYLLQSGYDYYGYPL